MEKQSVLFLSNPEGIRVERKSIDGPLKFLSINSKLLFLPHITNHFKVSTGR
jgi:hypothetical protein